MQLRWTEEVTCQQILATTDEPTISVHRHLDGKLLKIMKTRANPDGSVEIFVDVPLEGKNAK